MALLGCFGAFSYGSARVDYLPYGGELGTGGYFPFASQQSEYSVTQADVPDLVATRIFPAAAEPAIPVVITAIQQLPGIALKGIVELEGTLRGVLAGDAGEYVTLGAGERFLDATVLSVSSDRVLLSRGDGSEVMLLLRGAGELP